jgi:hypothetical protein
VEVTAGLLSECIGVISAYKDQLNELANAMTMELEQQASIEAKIKALAKLWDQLSEAIEALKKYRIIIEVTGDAPLLEANDAEEAIDEYTADVTEDDLLQLLTISAEEVK